MKCRQGECTIIAVLPGWGRAVLHNHGRMRGGTHSGIPAMISEAGHCERKPLLTPEKRTSVIIYTDGACKGNPGVGGWGAVLRAGTAEKELFGGARNTTNNRMELQAVIEALAILKRPCDITLYLDSQYVRKGITEWIKGWKAKGWQTAGKQPVKNVDLWQKLDDLVQNHGHRIHWQWVKGHAGNPGNEKADALANQGVASVSR